MIMQIIYQYLRWFKFIFIPLSNYGDVDKEKETRGKELKSIEMKVDLIAQQKAKI